MEEEGGQLQSGNDILSWAHVGRKPESERAGESGWRAGSIGFCGVARCTSPPLCIRKIISVSPHRMRVRACVFVCHQLEPSDQSKTSGNQHYWAHPWARLCIDQVNSIKTIHRITFVGFVKNLVRHTHTMTSEYTQVFVCVCGK